MNTPAPYPVIVVGLPRSMTYWLAQTLGFDHDATAWPVVDRKPGLCETGLYLLPREVWHSYLDHQTKVIYLRRPQDQVEISMAALFPGIDRPRLRQAMRLSLRAIKRFLEGRHHITVDSPLDTHGLTRIAAYLRRESELPAWESHLPHKRDCMREQSEIMKQCHNSLIMAGLLSHPQPSTL